MIGSRIWPTRRFQIIQGPDFARFKISILIYKELGFTLPQITQLLQEDIALENIQGMFKLKRSEIQQIIDTEQAKLVRIEERMQLIEKEGQFETGQEIRIKAEGAQSFLFQKACGEEEDIPDLLRQFDQLLTKETRQLIQGPQVVLWKEIDGKEDEFEMATMAFHSNSTFDCAACVHLARWIEKNNLGFSVRGHDGSDIRYDYSASYLKEKLNKLGYKLDFKASLMQPD